MGLLADIFSYGDGLKRKVNGLLQDPAGTVNLGAQRFAEDQNSLLALMDQAGYTPGSKSVLQRPQDQQQARNSLADKAMQTYGGLLGATVWHGSPHKFDKFDSSKIGTGEGAQAYGHGLYLAEHPEVAGQYARMNLTGPANVAHVAGRDGGDAVAALKQVYPGMPSAWYESALLKAKDAGYTYKVDLPDEHIAKMLDWDKPLSQQAPDVRDAVAKSFPGTYINGRYIDPANSQLTGKALLDQLTEIANKRGAPGMRQAEPALREAGIPGIRYLDGGSRTAGTGTSNYVVFPGNESLLHILERNGQPIK